MRKLIVGLLGLATLGLGALSAPQAEAQPYYGRPGYHRAPVVEYRAGPVLVREEYRRPHRHHYRPAPVYRPARAVRRCWSSLAASGTATAMCTAPSRSAAQAPDPARAGKFDQGRLRAPFFIEGQSVFSRRRPEKKVSKFGTRSISFNPSPSSW